MKTFGHSSGLEFLLRWSEGSPHGTAAEATAGELGLRFRGREVWPVPGSVGGFEWPWIEFLEHLARVWLRVRWEFIDPLSLGGPVRTLHTRAAYRWQTVQGRNRLVEEDAQLVDFLDAHDLSSGFNGIALPRLWILRQGRRVIVETEGEQAIIDATSVFPTLERLGDEIAARLEGLSDDRARVARTRWAARESGGAVEALRTLTNWPQAAAEWLKSFCGTGDFQTNEIAVAARMLGPLKDPKLFAPLFAEMKRTPLQDTTELDRWGSRARAAIAEPEMPHEQGYSLASWLRRDLLVSNDEQFDTEARLKALNVLIRELALPTVEVDAVCAWGPRHGPAIFINSKGVHAQGKRGRHATLAHELCHLLVDRGTTLEVAEVRGPNTPASVEARANAFAAELLVPRAAAATAFRNASATTVGGIITSLCTKYFASESIVAWQAINSGVKHTNAVENELRKRAAPFVELNLKTLAMIAP